MFLLNIGLACAAAGRPTRHVAPLASDVIVLGSRGRSALAEIVLGSVARNVLAGSKASVLVVREAAANQDRTG